MALCRPQRCRGLPQCHREQHHPLQGPAAPVGPLTASPRVPWPELTPEVHARGAAGAPPACLRRGCAAKTADHRTGTGWRRLGRSSVPSLTSKAGSFLAPGCSSFAQSCRPHLPLLHRPSPPVAPALSDAEARSTADAVRPGTRSLHHSCGPAGPPRAQPPSHARARQLWGRHRCGRRVGRRRPGACCASQADKFNSLGRNRQRRGTTKLKFSLGTRPRFVTGDVS